MILLSGDLYRSLAKAVQFWASDWNTIVLSLCGAVVTYTLMEDIIEFCTIEDAEHVFFYLETRIEALRKLYTSFEKSPAKMSVLRICNQLSRRYAPLSHSPTYWHEVYASLWTSDLRKHAC